MARARVCEASPRVTVRLGEWAKALKHEVMALYVAARDPCTPWTAKLIAGAVVAYALSPIDLIPDFVPVLGLLDDVILVPIGIWIALKLIPRDVMADARLKATAYQGRPTSYLAAVAIIVLWISFAALAVWVARRAGWGI